MSFLPGDLVYMCAEGNSSYTLWSETGKVTGASHRIGFVEPGSLYVVVATWHKRGQSELFVLCPTGAGWQVEELFRKTGAP